MTLYEIKKYLDKKWKFVVLKIAIDDIDDEIWAFKETEKEAIDCVKHGIEDYDNDPSWQFRYEKI